MTQPARTDDVPDTERCADWWANAYLLSLGLKPDTYCTCCPRPTEGEPQ